MILNRELERFLKKYDLSGKIPNIESENNFNIIMDKISSYIIENKYKWNFHVFSSIRELETIRTDYNRHIWLHEEKNKNILNEILKDNDFYYSNKYILYGKRIYVNFVIYKNKTYKLSETFNKCYIEDIKFLVYKFLISITGTGNHPNLSSDGNFSFVSRPSIDFNYNNIKIMLDTCRVANLDNCYDYDKSIFESIIN